MNIFLATKIELLLIAAAITITEINGESLNQCLANRYGLIELSGWFGFTWEQDPVSLRPCTWTLIAPVRDVAAARVDVSLGSSLTEGNCSSDKSGVSTSYVIFPDGSRKCAPLINKCYVFYERDSSTQSREGVSLLCDTLYIDSLYSLTFQLPKSTANTFKTKFSVTFEFLSPVTTTATAPITASTTPTTGTTPLTTRTMTPTTGTTTTFARTTTQTTETTTSTTGTMAAITTASSTTRNNLSTTQAITFITSNLTSTTTRVSKSDLLKETQEIFIPVGVGVLIFVLLLLMITITVYLKRRKNPGPPVSSGMQSRITDSSIVAKSPRAIARPEPVEETLYHAYASVKDPINVGNLYSHSGSYITPSNHPSNINETGMYEIPLQTPPPHYENLLQTASAHYEIPSQTPPSHYEEVNVYMTAKNSTA